MTQMGVIAQSKSPPARRHARSMRLAGELKRNRRLVATLCLSVSLLFPMLVSAADFTIKRGTTELIDGEYVLEAQIDYIFSDTALEALDNGVPLTIDLHIQIQRKGAWIWESRELEKHLRYMIRYHALADLYQVVDLNADTQQNFATRQAAITALGEISNVMLLKKSDLDSKEKYRVKLKATLDIEALPVPLRPLAYLSPSWNLSSKWHRWPLPY